jgi:hypothetical protein
MALLTNTPWINAAIDSRSVIVELFPAKQQNTVLACYACNLPDATFKRIAKRYSCSGLQRAAYLTRTVPTTTITASCAGALVSSELVRYLHNADLHGAYKTHSAQRVFFDTATPSVSRTYLPKAPQDRGCPGCGLHHALTLVDGKHRQAMPITQTVRLSDALIIACRCTKCSASDANTTLLKAMLGTRAREHSDAILRCPQCLSDTVSIDIRETLSGEEFENHFKDHAPDCAWLIQGDQCIDLLTGKLLKQSENSHD